MSELAHTAPAFVDVAHRIVWCTVATVSADGTPRTRILHPIWEWDGERLTGWIATARTQIKQEAIAANPKISLTYWDERQDTATADCTARWIDPTDKEALWARFAEGPEPVGYDPAMIEPWADGPSSPAFDGWVLDPFRLRVMPGSMLLAGEGELLTWSS